MSSNRPRLQMLKPQVRTLPARLITPATVASATRIRGRARQVVRHRILARDCGVCCCLACRRTGALELAHEVEHRLPLWAGGAEDDANRYAIASECHRAKTACETRMRANGGFDPSRCQCGRHGEADDSPTA